VPSIFRPFSLVALESLLHVPVGDPDARGAEQLHKDGSNAGSRPVCIYGTLHGTNSREPMEARDRGNANPRGVLSPGGRRPTGGRECHVS